MRSSLLVTLLLLSLTLPLVAQDVIVFHNGDRLTGRIKRMVRGKLILSSSTFDGDPKIDWQKIERIESDRTFQFETKRGVSFLATLSEEEATAEEIAVEVEGSTRSVPQNDVILMTETVKGVGGLLEISAGAGFSLTRSNNQKQLNAEATVTYDTPKYAISGGLNTLFTTQQSTNDTKRNNVWARVTKKFRGKWGAGAVSDFLTSSQQQLDLRTVLGGGPTYEFVQSNRLVLAGIGGAVWNNERYSAEAGIEPVNNDIEGLAGVDFSYFRFKQWNLDSTFFVFPGINSGGRVRMDWRTTFRVRLISGKRIWWNLNGTLNLDSDPPALSPGTDYVATTSITYDFP
jgi:uncharacterized protein DUF481